MKHKILSLIIVSGFLSACGSGSSGDSVDSRCVLSGSRGIGHFAVEASGRTAFVETVAGTGVKGYGGDGGLAINADFNTPGIVTWDSAGNTFLTDVFNNVVRRIEGSTGIVSTVAGTGEGGYGGDDGPAISALLSRPREVVADNDGNIYFVDLQNHRVRRVDGASGIITTVAGDGVEGGRDGNKSLGTYNGDNIPAGEAGLSRPHALVLSPDGDLYIADTRNHRVRVVDARTCLIRTIAGTGEQGYSGDGGQAAAAVPSRPHAAALDTAGNFYFVDLDNNVIRRIDRGTGIIVTVAGNGVNEYSGDGGPANLAGLSSPRGIAIDIAGNMYIATFDGNRVRRVDAESGTITTIAGDGSSGFSGDGGPAIEAAFAQPQGLTISPFGTLFLADWSNFRVREISFRNDASSSN